MLLLSLRPLLALLLLLILLLDLLVDSPKPRLFLLLALVQTHYLAYILAAMQTLVLEFEFLGRFLTDHTPAPAPHYYELIEPIVLSLSQWTHYGVLTPHFHFDVLHILQFADVSIRLRHLLFYQELDQMLFVVQIAESAGYHWRSQGLLRERT